MPLKRAIKLISKAQEEELKECAFRYYLTIYPKMKKETFISFEEYYDKFRPQQSVMDNRSKEEVMADILDIQNKFGNK